MGYLPQFINGDATALGKSLVTATPTQAAARDLIGLGEGDRPTFAGATIGNDYAPNTQINGRVKIDVQSAEGIHVHCTNNTTWRQPIITLTKSRPIVDGVEPYLRLGESIAALELGKHSSVRAIATEQWSADGRGTTLSFRTTPNGSVSDAERLRIRESGKVIIGSPYADDGEPDLLQVNGSTRVGSLYGDGGTLAIRNGTNAQSLLLTKTYTSDTNYEGLRVDAAADAYRIGSAVGSAGGTNRILHFGRWMADGSFETGLYISPSFTYISNTVTSGSANLLKLECRNLADGTLRGVSLAGVFRGTVGQEKLAGRISFSQTSSFLNNDLTNAAIDFSVVRQGVESVRMRLSHLGNLDLMDASGNRTLRLRGEDGGAEISGAVVLTNLPASDPAEAGQVWNNGGLLSMGEFDIEAAQDALDIGFLNVTETEITNDYIYYGGIRSGGSWKINRYDAVTLELTSATVASNAGYANLADAWANLETLNYE